MGRNVFAPPNSRVFGSRGPEMAAQDDTLNLSKIVGPGNQSFLSPYNQTPRSQLGDAGSERPRPQPMFKNNQNVIQNSPNQNIFRNNLAHKRNIDELNMTRN